MLENSSDLLALTSEPAILVQHGRLVFINSGARMLLGRDCTGEKLQNVLGREIAQAQASAFLADTHIGGRLCTVRVTKSGSYQLIFLSPADSSPALLNDPFICSMRSSLMTIGMSADKVRQRAEDIGDEQILSSLSALTRNYYRIIRSTNNASIILSVDSIPAPAASFINLSSLCRDIISAAKLFSDSPLIAGDFPEDIMVSADPALIKQLILNLISNCMVHAEGCSLIRLSLIDCADSVIISVSDDGCGIAPEQLHMVFDRYRHGFDIAGMSKGVGLGLSVARRVAEMHGGTLLLESRPGTGTTVRTSVSKKLSSGLSMKSSLSAPVSLRDVLIGLSDCLPESCYEEKYMD